MLVLRLQIVDHGKHSECSMWRKRLAGRWQATSGDIVSQSFHATLRYTHHTLTFNFRELWLDAILDALHNGIHTLNKCLFSKNTFHNTHRWIKWHPYDIAWIFLILNAPESSFYNWMRSWAGTCSHCTRKMYKIVTHHIGVCVTRESHKSCFRFSDSTVQATLSRVATRGSFTKCRIVSFVPSSNWTSFFLSFITFQIRTSVCVCVCVWAAWLLIICLLFLPKRKTKQMKERIRQTKEKLSKIIPTDEKSNINLKSTKKRRRNRETYLQ